MNMTAAAIRDANRKVAALKARGHYRRGRHPSSADIAQAIATFQSQSELDAALELESEPLNRKLLDAWGY